jgi:hypothetical protein
MAVRNEGLALEGLEEQTVELLPEREEMEVVNLGRRWSHHCCAIKISVVVSSCAPHIGHPNAR